MSKMRVLIAACFAVFLSLPGPGAAQEKDDKREKVRITTADGVELYAHFYHCTDPKVKSPPTILMLHPLGAGENSSKKAWIALANTLQTGASVMTFDFRGHGQSTEVEPEMFWKVLGNVNQIKNGAKARLDAKATIDFKEFERSYYSALVNDIYACKSYLDRKHDNGGCNTSSFVLLGAESGAALGAVWLNAEWHRHKIIPPQVAFGQATLDPRPEGQDVIACVWLSANSTFGPRDQPAPKTIQFGSTVSIALKEKATPMIFVYGDGDDKGKNTATAALKLIPSTKKKLYSWTDKVEVKNTKLQGIELLAAKTLRVDAAIHRYLFGAKDDPDDGVIKNKFRDYSERDFRKTEYRWRTPGTNFLTGQGLPAKLVAYPNDFVWDNFARYLK